jgi:hypothetical protein
MEEEEVGPASLVEERKYMKLSYLWKGRSSERSEKGSFRFELARKSLQGLYIEL